jgi:uncharacterized protein YfaS (alpha-2-macroglobulin family)
MVDESEVGQTLDTPIIALRPEVPHFVHWHDRQTLVVTHTEPWRPATRYEVTLRRPLASRLSREQRRHSFVHHPLELDGVPGVDMQWFPPSQPFDLRFNLPVEAEGVSRHCQIRPEGENDGVDLEPTGDEQTGTVIQVTPAEPLTQGNAYQLVCEDLQAQGGNEPMAGTSPTPLRVYPALAIEQLGPATTQDVSPDELQLVVTTTTPVAPKEIEKQLRISPRVPGFSRGWVSRTPTRFERVVTLDASTDYTITVRPHLVDEFGQRLGRAQRVSFRTSDATPRLYMETGIYAIEAESAGYPLWSRNVQEFEVECAQVPPRRVPQLLTTTMDYDPWYSDSRDDGIDWTELGLRPATTQVRVDRVLNRWQLHDLNLAERCGGRGSGLYLVEIRSAEVAEARGSERWWRYPYRLLGNVTNLGLLLKAGPSSGLVWVAQISDGAPVAGAAVTVYDPRGRSVHRGTTDRNGLLRLPGSSELLRQRGRGDSQDYDDEGWYDIDHYRQQRLIVVAEKSGDVAAVDGNWANGIQLWNFGVRPDTRTGGRRAVRGFILSDRGIYRPGETVHFKGFVRELAPGQSPQVPSANQLMVHLEDPTGTQISRRRVDLTAFGGFSFDQRLPAHAALGDYRVRATIDDHTFRERFTVQEFRPVPFEIRSMSDETAQPEPGSAVTLHFNATYLFGSPVTDASVGWSLHRRRRFLRFDDYPSFDFEEGSHGSFWGWHDEEASAIYVTGGTSQTDDSGDFTVEYRQQNRELRRPQDYIVRVTVADATDQEVSKRTVMTVHPTDRYLGLHTQEFVQAARMPFAVQAVAVTPEGRRANMAARLTLLRNRRVCEAPEGPDEYRSCRDEPSEVWTRPVTLAAGGVSTERIEVDEPGEYIIKLTGEDTRGTAVSTSSMVWVIGEGEAFWSGDESARMALIASKESYSPGETARLAARAPIGGSTALITIERDGVIDARVQRLPAGMPSIDIPLETAHAPNVFVSVAAVRGRQGESDDQRPFFALGLTNLKVSAENKRLDVQVTTAREEYRPGDTVTGQVRVHSQGEPVRAEISLSAANEGVLQLINYQTPDPMAAFYRPWGLGVENATSWNRIVRRRGPVGWNEDDEPGDTGGQADRIRSRFVSSAFWAPALMTDGEGQASFSFEAPDNLTAFRLMAAAADNGDQFGSGETRIRVRKDLVVNPIAPRFLNGGDRIELGAVVHNYTGRTGEAHVVITTKGLTPRRWEKQVEVAPNRSQRVVFWGKVSSDRSRAELNIRSKLGEHNDALVHRLPIRRPLIEDHQLVMKGRLASGEVEQELTWQETYLPARSRLQVTVDGTGLAELEPSLRHLIKYPHGCLEQTVSRIIPLCAAQDLATSLRMKGLRHHGRLKTFIALGVGQIIRHQHSNGQFSPWPSSRTDPYLTAYAMWGLSQARQAGVWIRHHPLKRGLNALKNWANHRSRLKRGHELGTMAMAAYVLAAWDQADQGLNARLYEQREAMPRYGQAFLLRALTAAKASPAQRETLITGLEQAAVGDDSQAEITETEGASTWYHSNVRSSAVTLSALVESRPDHPLVPRLAQGLKARRRTGGHWGSTHNNLYALVGLADYARVQSRGQARISVYLGKKRLLKGVINRRKQVLHYSSQLSKLQPGKLRVKATGTTYYNATLHLSRPPSANDATSAGLELRREYLHFASGVAITEAAVGDLVRVRLHLSTTEPRDQVALTDPIPSGFEAVNADLATEAGAGPSGDSRYRRRRSSWTHHELHDDRATAYATRISDEATFEYVLRAIRRGTFAVPPAFAEAMYAPEIHGRTAGTTMTVR